MRVSSKSLHSFNINLGPDTTICLNETLALSVPGGYLNYLWHPHNQVSDPRAHNVTVSPKVNTTFAVEVEVIKGCMIKDTITVSVKTCPEYIYFPNSFTPSNDGINDSFKPKTAGVFEKYELQVFNRWGQRIFFTGNRNEGWNGKYKGNLQGDGTFIWLCRYKSFNKPEKVQKGLVSIFK